MKKIIFILFIIFIVTSAFSVNSTNDRKFLRAGQKMIRIGLPITLSIGTGNVLFLTVPLISWYFRDVTTAFSYFTGITGFYVFTAIVAASWSLFSISLAITIAGFIIKKKSTVAFEQPINNDTDSKYAWSFYKRYRF